MDVNKILSERQGTHGDYFEHTFITRQIKDVMSSRENWNLLDVCQKESLDMIAHKIGRILAGNPNWKDHWDDIAGYATLVSNRLESK